MSETCAACHTPFAPASTTVRAGNKRYHKDHFVCSVCKMDLVGQPYIDQGDVLYCREDYEAAFLPKCTGCKKTITAEYMEFESAKYHPECFVCQRCSSQLGESLYMMDGVPVCESCYQQKAEKCTRCSRAIEGAYITVKNAPYHKECWRCSVCDGELPTEFYQVDGKPVCDTCHLSKQTSNPCATCNKPILDLLFAEVEGRRMHHACFTCVKCNTQLLASKDRDETRSVYRTDSGYVCVDCHLEGASTGTTSQTTTTTTTTTTVTTSHA